jgi:hypothetical protein
MNVYSLDAVTKYLSTSKVIEKISVSQAEVIDFNSMEGFVFFVRVNVTTQKEYKNKRIKMITNSTYLDFYKFSKDKSTKQNFQDMLETFLG